jgi:hypothetical protein
VELDADAGAITMLESAVAQADSVSASALADCLRPSVQRMMPRARQGEPGGDPMSYMPEECAR